MEPASHAGPFVVGVDFGGTKMRVGAVSPIGRVIAAARGRTDPSDPARGIDRLSELIEEVCRQAEAAGGSPKAIGVGAPGPLDAVSGRLLNPPNLPGWLGYPLVAELTLRLGLPVALDNDANVAALGERWLGAARSLRDFIYVTLGTGIGGAVFVDGRLVRGVATGAGELGHIQLDPQGSVCGCGRRGCVESLAAGPAIAREAGVATAEEVFAAAAAGEAKARVVLEKAGAALGRGLAAACSLLDPEAVVVGGGMTAAEPDGLAVYLRAAAVALAETAFLPPGREVPICLAELGADAGIVGAAALALQKSTQLHASPFRLVDKPWGREVWWAQTDRYVGKLIEVRAGCSLSLQYHQKKLETMLFTEGYGTVILGDEALTVFPGRSVTITPGTRHRVIAASDIKFYEVSTPEVEDVVRLKDDYGRVEAV